MIGDWDDAYANAPHIAGAEAYPPRWAQDAASFRARMAEAGRAELGLAYGAGERQRLDIFHPDGPPRGLAMFVHGGYWMAFDGTTWSHLAAGARAAGFAVAVPSYTLAPQARISAITAEIGAALGLAASRIDGPIRLAGHSAGGHLVTRMACAGAPVEAPVQVRIAHVLSISGLHDLRPLMRTAMNDRLRLDAGEARRESAALLEPVVGTRLTCWVGAAERPEFLRQNALLANVWTGLGAATRSVEDPGRHHFDVVAGLSAAESPITRAFTGDDGWG